MLHNIVYNFFSTCRHALRARTTMAAAPAREPAHAARATPPHAHMHAQLASQQAHTHLHITTASTARFYAVTHGNKTARLRAVNRPAFARCILPLNSLSPILKALRRVAYNSALLMAFITARITAIFERTPRTHHANAPYRSRPRTHARQPPRRPPPARLGVSPERERTNRRHLPRS